MARTVATLVLAFALAACGGSSPAASDLTSRADAEAALSQATGIVAQSTGAPGPVQTASRADLRSAQVALAEGRLEETLHFAQMAQLRLAIADLEATAGTVSPSLSDDERRLRITDAFLPARTTLRPGPQGAVDSLAAYLVARSDRAVLIESFTDATGDEARNLDLSVRRAAAVRDRLVEAGVDSSHVVVEGYGQAFPISDNETPSGQRENRRIEVVVADAISSLPERRGDS